MRKLGSPFQAGTLSYLIFSIVLLIAIVYSYVTAEVRRPLFLFMVAVSVGISVRAYFSYIKFWNNGERRLIEDPD